MIQLSDKPTTVQLHKVMANHGIEVWEGYAVEVYVTADSVVGQRFIPLESFKTFRDVRDWLGY